MLKPKITPIGMVREDSCAHLNDFLKRKRAALGLTGRQLRNQWVMVNPQNEVYIMAKYKRPGFGGETIVTIAYYNPDISAWVYV